MAAGETKFECGRYRGKTYAFVENIDKDFCQLALDSRTSNKYCPESFKNYLTSRLQTAPINESGAIHFVDAIISRPNLTDELIQLVGNPPVVIETIHDRLNLESNGFKGVFFRYAFSKYVFNLKNENAHSHVLNVHVNIFPFKIEPDVRSLADKVVCQLDDIFIEEIRSFLVTYFDDFDVAEHHRDIIDNFLSNIVHFRDYHFVDNAVTKAFCRWVKKDFVRSTPFNRNVFNQIPQIPRLNVKGARRYIVFYESYNVVASMYGQKTLPIPTNKELMYLPEKNIYDLLSLIDCDFYQKNRAEYTNRFEKYILFFVYSLYNVDQSSVFLIDDCLYECAKAFTTYRRCGTDPAAFKFEMSLCALIHRRKQPQDYPSSRVGERWYQIKDQDLFEVERAAELYPKIETAKVNDTMENTQLPETIPYLRTDDDLMDFCLSYKSRDNIIAFLYLVVSSALYEHDFKHLVIYNALLGEKSYIEITPERKRKVAEFIAKHNTNDSKQKIPPGKRLTWGFEDCFVDGTYHK